MKGSCSDCIEVKEKKDDVSLFVGIEERRVPDLVASLCDVCVRVGMFGAICKVVYPFGVE